MIRIEGRRHRLPYGAQFVAMDQFGGDTLVVPAVGKEFLLGGVRECEVADVVAQGSHSQNLAPIVPAVGSGYLGNDFPDSRVDVVVGCDDIEYSPCQLHHA